MLYQYARSHGASRLYVDVSYIGDLVLLTRYAIDVPQINDRYIASYSVNMR